MTLQDLKTILVNHLDCGNSRQSDNEEIVDLVVKGKATEEIEPAEVFAFQVNGTTIFLSDAGLAKPKRVIFVDLKNRKTFLQEVE